MCALDDWKHCRNGEIIVAPKASAARVGRATATGRPDHRRQHHNVRKGTGLPFWLPSATAVGRLAGGECEPRGTHAPLLVGKTDNDVARIN